MRDSSPFKGEVRRGMGCPSGCPLCAPSPVRSMRGKLNEFQKNVLRWNRVHPYNAVHAVRIPRPLDPSRLIETINGELESLGLTGLVIDRRRYTFEYGGGPART